MTGHKKAVLYLFLAALLWSMGGLLIKSVNWNPMAIAGSRSAIAAVFMILLLRPRFRPDKVKILGGIAYAATVTLFVTANKMTTAANAILLQYTAPVYVAVFGWWFLKEKITRIDWITILMVMAGMVLFFMDELSPGNMLGNIIAILSGVAFAWLVLLLRKQKEASPVDSVIIGNIITAIAGLPFMFNNIPDASGWTALLILGIFQLGISYVLYSWAVKHVSAIEAILIPVIEPILNPIWVVIMLGETPGTWALAGGLVVLASITLRSLAVAWKWKKRSLNTPDQTLL